HLRVPDHRAGAVPRDQGHQRPEAPAAALTERTAAAADERRTVADRDPRPAREEVRNACREPARSRRPYAMAWANASRVRFSQPPAVMARLSSIRMPPKRRN